MKRFLINVYTNWCGEDQTFCAYANDDSELDDIANNLSYENFSSFSGLEGILEELFPDVEEYTDEMYDTAARIEGEYYGHNIEEWDESRDEEEWDWYDLVYDEREKNA